MLFWGDKKQKKVGNTEKTPKTKQTRKITVRKVTVLPSNSKSKNNATQNFKLKSSVLCKTLPTTLLINSFLLLLLYAFFGVNKEQKSWTYRKNTKNRCKKSDVTKQTRKISVRKVTSQNKHEK